MGRRRACSAPPPWATACFRAAPPCPRRGFVYDDPNSKRCTPRKYPDGRRGYSIFRFRDLPWGFGAPASERRVRGPAFTLCIARGYSESTGLLGYLSPWEPESFRGPPEWRRRGVGRGIQKFRHCVAREYSDSGRGYSMFTARELPCGPGASMSGVAGTAARSAHSVSPGNIPDLVGL